MKDKMKLIEDLIIMSEEFAIMQYCIEVGLAERIEFADRIDELEELMEETKLEIKALL